MSMFKKKSNTNKDLPYSYASFTRHVLAATIDLVAIIVLLQIFMGTLATFGLLPNLNLEQIALQSNMSGTDEDGQLHFTDALTQFFILLYKNKILYQYITIMFIIPAIVSFTYILCFWIYLNTTPGKFLTRCKIVNVKTMKSPSKRAYFIRAIGYIIDTLLLGLGFVIAYFNKQGRGIHDFMAGTVVIVENKKHNNKSNITK